MKLAEKALRKKAEELGITADELLEELEVGDPDKPFVLAVTFSRLSEVKEFAESLGRIGVGVYRADTLDREYNGAVRKNSFVLRSVRSTSKPDEWRIA